MPCFYIVFFIIIFVYDFVTSEYCTLCHNRKEQTSTALENSTLFAMILSKSNGKQSEKRKRVVEQIPSLTQVSSQQNAFLKIAVQILAIILVRKKYSGIFRNNSFKYYRQIQIKHLGGWILNDCSWNSTNQQHYRKAWNKSMFNHLLRYYNKSLIIWNI